MFDLRLLAAVLLFLSASIINGQKQSEEFEVIKGRLLTPQVGCGFTKVRNTKIISGSRAKPGAWPWIVSVGFYKYFITYQHECGGSLITSKHVLTAGHCQDSAHYVRLGGYDREEFVDDDEPHQYIKVIHIKRHPNYKSSSGTDIAILYLQRDVEFTDRIHPICLPMNEPIRSQSFIGTNPFVAGWGSTFSGGDRARYLMQTQIPVLNNTFCEETLIRLNFEHTDFPDDTICAGNFDGGYGNVCHGDSGGPLMLPIHQSIHQSVSFPFFQIGIVSFSINCNERNSIAGFASTQFHADWIQEMVNLDIE